MIAWSSFNLNGKRQLPRNHSYWEILYIYTGFLNIFLHIFLFFMHLYWFICSFVNPNPSSTPQWTPNLNTITKHKSSCMYNQGNWYENHSCFDRYILILTYNITYINIVSWQMHVWISNVNTHIPRNWSNWGNIFVYVFQYIFMYIFIYIDIYVHSLTLTLAALFNGLLPRTQQKAQ